MLPLINLNIVSVSKVFFLSNHNRTIGLKKLGTAIYTFVTNLTLCFPNLDKNHSYNQTMYLKNIIVILYILFSLISCSSSYESLSNTSYKTTNEFSEYLLREYTKKADFEATEMHDWNSTKLYSEKAIKAANGVSVEPEKISYWKIPNEHITELQKAYDNLMKVYTYAIISNPHDLAVAISSLDCWAEQQEENWQTWDIELCKENFLKAIHNIYRKISDNEKINQNKIKTNNQNKIIKEDISESVTIVTKDFNEEIRQIIYFDFDKSILTNVSLQEIKNFLTSYRDNIKKYLIVGHTDTKGTKKYNLALSLERALSIQKILISNGINKANIRMIGKGENELTIQTKDEIAHPANRRAEISPIN